MNAKGTPLWGPARAGCGLSPWSGVVSTQSDLIFNPGGPCDSVWRHCGGCFWHVVSRAHSAPKQLQPSDSPPVLVWWGWECMCMCEREGGSCVCL